MELLGNVGRWNICSLIYYNIVPCCSNLSAIHPVRERDELLLQKPLGILNDALAGQAFLTGDCFTVADLNVASIVVWGKMARLDLSAHPDVTRWLERGLARPAYGRVLDLQRRRLRLEMTGIHHVGRPMSLMGLGRVKTKSDLVVVPSGRQIFAFFYSPRDRRAQNSGCGYTA